VRSRSFAIRCGNAVRRLGPNELTTPAGGSPNPQAHELNHESRVLKQRNNRRLEEKDRRAETTACVTYGTSTHPPSIRETMLPPLLGRFESYYIPEQRVPRRSNISPPVRYATRHLIECRHAHSTDRLRNLEYLQILRVSDTRSGNSSRKATSTPLSGFINKTT